MFWYRSVVSAHDVADQCHYLCKSVMVWTDNASNHLIHNAKLQSRLSQTEDVIFLSLAIVFWILNVISITLLFSEAGCEAAMMMMVIISWWSWRQGVWSLFRYHGHIVLWEAAGGVEDLIFMTWMIRVARAILITWFMELLSSHQPQLLQLQLLTIISLAHTS